MVGNIGQTNVTRRPQAPYGGLMESNPLDVIRNLMNQDPQAQEVRTITVTGATNSTAYIIVVDGRSVTYTSDASATIAEIADGLAAACIVDPIANASAAAVSDGVSVVTFTARQRGVAFTLTTANAQLTAALVTAAASADAVPFGRVMISQATDSQDPNEPAEIGIMAKSTAFTAQVVTVTPTYVANAEYTAKVRDMQTGRIIADFTAVGDTSLADLLAELEVGLDTQLPANTVEVTDPASTSLVFTAELAGYEFDVEFGVGEQGASTPTFTNVQTTGPSPSTSLQRAIAGISLHSGRVEANTVAGADAQYDANEQVDVISHGRVFVENSQTIVKGTAVFVELDATSDDRAKCFNTTSATRVQLPLRMAKWIRGAVDSTISAVAGLYLDVEENL